MSAYSLDIPLIIEYGSKVSNNTENMTLKPNTEQRNDKLIEYFFRITKIDNEDFSKFMEDSTRTDVNEFLEQEFKQKLNKYIIEKHKKSLNEDNDLEEEVKFDFLESLRHGIVLKLKDNVDPSAKIINEKINIRKKNKK